MTYSKNIGFQEMIGFSQVATPGQQAKMDKIVSHENWEAYKNLVAEVLGTELK